MQRERFRVARPVAKLREGKTDWYKISNLADGGAVVAIYDEIGFFGVTAAAFIDELNAITADTITLRLASPGGEVFDGVNIYNALVNHPAHIDVQIDSLAASIASVIAMAGDTITMSGAAQMMIHEGFTMFAGPADEMRATADQLDKASNMIASVYAARTGKPVADWRAAMRAETWYTADEAVAAGLADKVAPLKGRPAVATASSAATAWDLSVFKNTPQAMLNAATGSGYKPKPYSRESYENVKCPECGKYSDSDAQNCGQCGAKLAGRDDVQADDGSDSMTDRAKAALIAAGLDPALLLAAVPAVPQPVAPVVAVAPTAPIAGVVTSPTGADKPDVDNSAWDASKAWHGGVDAKDPEAYYGAICAGKKGGDPATQAAWALPYRYGPDDPPNAAGVRDALARLSQTQGLINKSEAQEVLQDAMKKVNPDYKPGDRMDTSLLSAVFTQGLRGATK